MNELLFWRKLMSDYTREYECVGHWVRLWDGKKEFYWIWAGFNRPVPLFLLGKKCFSKKWGSKKGFSRLVVGL